MNNVLLINKEPNMTSFDVVNRCKHLFHEKRIGHTGTLDPNATGLLIILLGKATKLLPYCVSDQKHYIATFELGKQTDTQDIWGEVINQNEPKSHTQEELDFVAQSFLGDGIQTPPMYSAIKVNGQKLYDLARKGQEIERKPRPVTINALKVHHLENNTYQMDAIVSGGTYIRTLIEDYASKLNELGVMTSLNRIGIEHLSLEQSYSLTEIENNQYSFLNASDVISKRYPIIETDEIEDIMHGKRIQLDIDDKTILFKNKGMLLAAYEKREDQYYHCLRGLY